MVAHPSIPLKPGGARFLFSTNECVGLGHLRRTMNLAEAVTRRDGEASALVITGAPAALGERRHPRVDTVKLPELSRGRDGDLHAARLGLGAAQLHDLRAHLSLAAAGAFAPDVAVIDKTPLGLNEELVPTLEALRESGRTRIVLGLRDIEDAPELVARRWARSRVNDMIARYYDAILVYGPRPADDEPDVRRLEEAGIPIHHVGYVGAPLPATGPTDIEPGYVLVTAGGGADGYPLFDAVLGAVARSGLDAPMVMVTGPLMPADQRADIRARAAALGITAMDFRADMPAVIVGSRAVVAMAGYNTVSEVVRAGKPVLLLPRTAPSREQLVRATALAAAGAAAMIPLDRATPTAVRRGLAEILTAPAPPRDRAVHDGADRAAEVLCGLAADAEAIRPEPALALAGR